jgi:DNA-binding XRE family transcriptional regulator
MKNTQKKYRENNFQTIMYEQKLSPQKMAKKLGVTLKTIDNYRTNLPIDVAIAFSKEYGYTLDWIYRNSHQKYLHPNRLSLSEPKIPNSSPLIDVRKYVFRFDEEIFFAIPHNYWEYMIQLDIINSSGYTSKVKASKIDVLNTKYNEANPNDFCHCFSIPVSNLSNFFNFNGKFVPYADINTTNGTTLDDIFPSKSEPTKKEMEEAISFIEALISTK